jgi:predicted dehydrogenase
VRSGRGGPADDDLDARLVHVGGATSRIVCGWVSEQSLPRLRITGTEAGYTVGDSDTQEAALKRGERPSGPGFGQVPPERWGRLTSVDGTSRRTPTANGDYAAFYRGLARHLTEGGPLPVDPLDAVRTLEILETLLAGRLPRRAGRHPRHTKEEQCSTSRPA